MKAFLLALLLLLGVALKNTPEEQGCESELTKEEVQKTERKISWLIKDSIAEVKEWTLQQLEAQENRLLDTIETACAELCSEEDIRRIVHEVLEEVYQQS